MFERMKRLTLYVLTVVCGVGCTSQLARQTEYDSYINTKLEMARLMSNAKPIIDYTGTDSGGKEFRLVVNLPMQMPDVQQIKNDESYAFWGQVLGSTIPAVGAFASSWVNSYYSYKNNQSMWGALDNAIGAEISVGGNAYITGSGNSITADSLGGSLNANDFISIPTTTTTTHTTH